MKTLYFFQTQPWVYATELPVIAIFFAALYANSLTETKTSFLPLVVAMALAFLFILVYFTRFVSLSTEEARQIGLFGSKDREFLKENSVLIIKLRPFGNMKLELWGGNPDMPAFDWMKADDVNFREVCLFREKAIGGIGSAKRILSYYTVPKDSLAGLENEGYFFENDTVSVSTEKKNEVYEIKVSFKKIVV